MRWRRAQRKDERHTESEALYQLKWEWHPRVVAAFE